MASSMCEHAALLRVANGASGSTFRYGGRYQRIIQDMTNPEEQLPRLMLFVGKRNKDRALRDMFPHNNLRRQPVSENAINLRADNDTLRSAHPLLFFECDPLARSTICEESQRAFCHQDEEIPILWAANIKHNFLDVIVARLLCLFTDVICIFADDIGGIESVKGLLLKWAAVGSAATSALHVRPRVVIAMSKQKEQAKPSNPLDIDAFRCDVLQDIGLDLSQTFASICTVEISDNQKLREELVKQADITQKTRSASSNLLSAIHQEALFCRAIYHTARTVQESFDHVQSARAGNELTADFSQHLENALTLFQVRRVPDEIATAYIASTILMDAYPPGAAGKWSSPLLSASANI